MDKVILIVEDEDLNRELARVLLRREGYSTIETDNGKEGVRLARQKKPDLILMDIHLPIMDGIEATRLLKEDENMRSTPIVALTAFAMKGDRERMLLAGCDGYISKPIDNKAFIEVIHQYLQQ